MLTPGLDLPLNRREIDAQARDPQPRVDRAIVDSVQHVPETFEQEGSLPSETGIATKTQDAPAPTTVTVTKRDPQIEYTVTLDSDPTDILEPALTLDLSTIPLPTIEIACPTNPLNVLPVLPAGISSLPDDVLQILSGRTAKPQRRDFDVQARDPQELSVGSPDIDVEIVGPVGTSLSSGDGRIRLADTLARREPDARGVDVQARDLQILSD